MDRPADILDRGIAQDLHVAGLLVDLYVTDMRRKAGSGALRVDRHLGADRTAGPPRLQRDLGQGQRLEAAGVGAGRPGHAVLPLDRVGADVPDHRGAFFELVDDLLGGLGRRHAGRERDATAAGQERKTDRAGVGDDRTDLFDRYAEDLGRHHRHRGARAADVRVADRDDRSAVLVDVAGRTRLAADVEPEARRDAAALVGPELFLQVWMVLGRFDRRGIADILPGRAVQCLDAVLGRILFAQCQRVDAELVGQFIEAALDPVGRVRRAGSAIGGDLRAIADDIVAGDLGVWDVVHRKGAHAARPDRRAREGASLVFEHGLGRGQPAILLGPELDLDDRTRRRPGAAEHLLAAHNHLDRPAGHLRHRQGQRLEINQGLAAKAAADLGRDRADLRDVDAEQFGAIGAHHELALARAPDRALAVRGDRHHAGMRLDIGLVHRRVRIAPLDDDVGVAEPGVDVALGEADHLGDVRSVRRLGIDTLGKEIVVQDRRIGLHRLFDVDDMRQHVVFDLDQLAGLLGDRRRGRRHRRDGVTVIKHLVARQAVARQVAKVHRPLADKGLLRRDRREILRGYHRLDAGQCPRLLGIDRHDPRMGMGAALDLAPEHAGHDHVGAEIGAAGDLVDPVRADRTGADDLLQFLRHIRHEMLTPA